MREKKNFPDHEATHKSICSGYLVKAHTSEFTGRVTSYIKQHDNIVYGYEGKREVTTRYREFQNLGDTFDKRFKRIRKFDDEVKRLGIKI